MYILNYWEPADIWQKATFFDIFWNLLVSLLASTIERQQPKL